MLLVLIPFSLNYVMNLLRENWCWSTPTFRQEQAAEGAFPVQQR